MIVFKETVDPFACARVCSQSPNMPSVLMTGVLHKIIAIRVIDQRACGILRSRYQHIFVTVYPHGVVVNTYAYATLMRCFDQILDSQR